jgi:MFS family permease
MPALRRNRDFVLLQAGQLLSSAGSQATGIAYPLLVLATTGSAAQAGLVSFAGLGASALLGLPAGVAADRLDRRRLMIAADAVRAVTIAALAVAVAFGDAPLGAIVAAAFVEGGAAALFSVAEPGALRAVVPPTRLADAGGIIAARRAAVNVAGPTLGGALFGLGRAVPFAFDTVSYLASSVSLLAMRARFQEARTGARTTVRRQLAEGLGFLWRQPFLRTCAAIYGVGNFLIPGVVLILVVQARDEGLSAGATGLLLTLFGAGTLAGSLASPVFRRHLPVRAILLMELWSWLWFWAFVAWPSVWVLTAACVALGVALPVTDSVVVALQLALTPERLLGRVESARRTIALAIAPLGPLVAGLLLGATSSRATVAVFAGIGLLLALWGTLSPAVRRAPRLEHLAAVATAASRD